MSGIAKEDALKTVMDDVPEVKEEIERQGNVKTSSLDI